MIELTRLGGHRVTVNADLILTLEQTPDTLVGLVNGDNLLVRETPDAIIALVVEYRRRCGGMWTGHEAEGPAAAPRQS